MEATINDDGDVLISLGRPEKTNLLKAVFYVFVFDGIPDEVTEVETGDTVKISGRVLDFGKSTTNKVLFVRSEASHIVK